jgi:hypothetical protein
MAGQGFHTHALNSNEAFFGEKYDRVSTLSQELEPVPAHLKTLHINYLVRNWTGFPRYMSGIPTASVMSTRHGFQCTKIFI